MKKSIIIILTLSASLLLKAQQQNSISFIVGGGVHNLTYKVNDGLQKGQNGIAANLGFSHYFSNNIGIETGVDFQTYGASSTLNYLEMISDIDSDGDEYIFKTNFKDWQEKQQTINVGIPLMGVLKYPISKNISLKASIGGAISFPLKSSFNTTSGEIITSGFYPQWNVELTDLPQHKFTTMTDEYKGNNKLNTAYLAIIQIGGLYKISDKMDFYGGIYFNQGLNNVLKSSNKYVLQSDLIYNGIFDSYQTQKVQLVSYGIKCGLSVKL